MTHAEFKSIRLSAGISQVNLATALSITVRALHHWENGKRKVPGSVAGIMRLLAADRIQLSEIKELCS